MSNLPENISKNDNERAFKFINTLIDYEFAGNTIDSLKEWKLKNQVDIVLKSIEYINIAQIQPQKIKIKEITKFLEYCSFESNNDMQLKWAALLANTLIMQQDSISITVFAEILNQLSDNEINIIELLFDESFIESSEKKAELGLQTIVNKLNISLKLGEILLENLLRLNLLKNETKQKKKANHTDPYFGEQETKADMEELISLSPLGQSFVQQINFQF